MILIFSFKLLNEFKIIILKLNLPCIEFDAFCRSWNILSYIVFI